MNRCPGVFTIGDEAFTYEDLTEALRRLALLPDAPVDPEAFIRVAREVKQEALREIGLDD